MTMTLPLNDLYIHDMCIHLFINYKASKANGVFSVAISKKKLWLLRVKT